MRIKQAYISPILKHFKKDFLSYWNLEEYNDPTQPAMFFGAYTREDVAKLLFHKNFSLLHFGSTRDFDTGLIQNASAVILSNALASEKPVATNSPNVKVLNIAIKDYSAYQLTPLGKKIYIYKGINGDKDKYYNEGIEDALNASGYETISVSGVTNEYLCTKIYPQTFCFVKSKTTGGNTTKWELGLMGRPTYHNVSDLKTTFDPKEIRENTLKQLTLSDNWLDTSFWA